ncbi:hypothetical protein ACIBU0_16095 [Streptomyces sp. NPDC049627]|uniref:hypothetical protein n=1 Tax=Streptomyces sp. NPDC049627 TaxID=3365595 RepID=UPI00379F2082
MTAMISVRVEGPVGLDEPEELLRELGRETGLAWRLETAGQKGTLDGGLAVTMLEALVGGAAGAVVQMATQRAIDVWRGRRLDPPTVTVVFQPAQAPQPAQDPEPESQQRSGASDAPEGS